MATGAYCYLQGCTVYCSTVPVTGASVWVWGPSPYINYSITNFCQYFPQAGFTVPAWCKPPQTQPAPVQPAPPPPPPPPGTGVPVEIPPPAAAIPPGEDHETAPPHEVIPPDLCGKTAVPSAAAMVRDYGFKMEEHLSVPHVGSLTPLNIFESATPDNQGNGLIAKNKPIFTKYGRKEIVDGKLQLYHNPTGPGYVVFASPDLPEITLWGANQTGAKSKWPTDVTSTTFLIHSGIRDDGSTGDIASQRLAWGLPHKTSEYPKSGFVIHRPLGDDLEIQATDSSGLLTADCTKLVHFKNSVEIDCDLTVTGSIIGDVVVTGVDSWTTIDTTTSAGSPSSVVLSDDFSAEGTYKIFYNVTAYTTYDSKAGSYSWDGVVLYNQPSDTNDFTEEGSWYDEIVGTSITGTAFTYSDDGAGIISITLQGYADETECTNWKIKYRIEYVAPGAC